MLEYVVDATLGGTSAGGIVDATHRGSAGGVQRRRRREPFTPHEREPHHASAGNRRATHMLDFP